MARIDTKGSAAKCSLTVGIDGSQTVILITGDVSGWPTGAGGRHFEITLERGTSRMEKVECSGLTGANPATLTVVTRGYDGSQPQSHQAGIPVEHGFPALLLDDLSGHVYDITRDDHTQYVRVDGSRSFSALTAVTGAPVSVGTANTIGSALTLARSDHVHSIAANAVGPTQLAATVVGTGLAGAAGVALSIADGGVGTTQLADNGVTAAKIAGAVVGTGLTGGAGTAISVAAGGIGTTQLANGAVTGVKLSSGNHVLSSAAVTATHDVTSASFADVGDTARTITVPSWATTAIVTTHLTGATSVTASARSQIKTIFNGVSGTVRELLTLGDSGNESASWTDSFTLGGTGSLDIHLRALRAAGTGSLRVVAATVVDYDIWFS